MNSVDEPPEQTGQAHDGALRPRRRMAKDLLERGQRLRSRARVLIGVSMGVAALLTVME